MTQTTVYDFLPHARRTDPATSHDAAHHLADKATMMRTLLLAYRIQGFTAEEASAVAGYGPEHGAWKRVSDLIRLGYLEPTGDTRTGTSGRQQRVLQITKAGVESLTAGR